MTYIRHGIAAIAGAIAAAILGLLISVGIDVDPEASAGLIAFLEGVLMAAALAGYAFVEKYLKRFSWLDLEGWVDRVWRKHAANKLGGDPDSIAVRKIKSGQV